MIAFRTDNPAADVLRLLAEYGIGPDKAFRGEIARLFDGRGGYKRLYYRKGGPDLDGFGEILYDAGVTVDRATPDDIVCYLDDLLRKQARKRGRKRATASEVDEMLTRAKTVRARLWECPQCQQKARGTRNTALICGVCYEMTGEIVKFERKDPVPEEIIPLTYQVNAECAA